MKREEVSYTCDGCGEPLQDLLQDKWSVEIIAATVSLASPLSETKHYCRCCWIRMECALDGTHQCPQPVSIQIDANDAVAQALKGQQDVCERDDCCQTEHLMEKVILEKCSKMEDTYGVAMAAGEVDFPTILPPEDVTLTAEEYERLMPHTVVAGRLE